jgi:hypothetical protein
MQDQIFDGAKLRVLRREITCADDYRVSSASDICPTSCGIDVGATPEKGRAACSLPNASELIKIRNIRRKKRIFGTEDRRDYGFQPSKKADRQRLRRSIRRPRARRAAER